MQLISSYLKCDVKRQNNPCKIATGILPGSRQESRSHWDPSKIPLIWKFSCRDPVRRKFLSWILAGFPLGIPFLPGSRREKNLIMNPGENLTEKKIPGCIPGENKNSRREYNRGKKYCLEIPTEKFLSTKCKSRREWQVPDINHAKYR